MLKKISKEVKNRMSGSWCISKKGRKEWMILLKPANLDWKAGLRIWSDIDRIRIRNTVGKC